MQKTNILFLQGPLGSFFQNLARFFSQSGYITHKINFNAGDKYFSSADFIVDFQGDVSEWPDFFASYIVKCDIKAVFLLGDCRLYHRLVKPICENFGVHFMVFEEGYLRPNTITLEVGGVNAFSQLDLSVDTVKNFQPEVFRSNVKMGGSMRSRTVAAAFYYWAAWFGKNQFPYYQHHRAFNPVREGYCWLKGFARREVYKRVEKKLQQQLLNEYSGRFILVPLQVHDDSQKIYHSDYETVEAFIEEVMTSFGQHSDVEKVLCFKHHPMDIGYTHYGRFIKQLAKKLGLSDRVFYCHEIPLPDLYHHAHSVVTVNSTVGLSAILHQLPTLATGKAIYDMEGLTHQGSMASFWQDPEPVDVDLFQRFHSLIYSKTQINASFFNYPEISCRNSITFFEQLTGITSCSIASLTSSEAENNFQSPSSESIIPEAA